MTRQSEKPTLTSRLELVDDSSVRMPLELGAPLQHRIDETLRKANMAVSTYCFRLVIPDDYFHFLRTSRESEFCGLPGFGGNLAGDAQRFAEAIAANLGMASVEPR